MRAPEIDKGVSRRDRDWAVLREDYLPLHTLLRLYVVGYGHFVSACRIGSLRGTASFRPKVALSHGSISKLTWLHNNRVYRMADEWAEIEYHSSYVLRNEFGERGNYTFS